MLQLRAQKTTLGVPGAVFLGHSFHAFTRVSAELLKKQTQIR